jgi:hypothetical protein
VRSCLFHGARSSNVGVWIMTVSRLRTVSLFLILNVSSSGVPAEIDVVS